MVWGTSRWAFQKLGMFAVRGKKNSRHGLALWRGGRAGSRHNEAFAKCLPRKKRKKEKPEERKVGQAWGRGGHRPVPQGSYHCCLLAGAQFRQASQALGAPRSHSKSPAEPEQEPGQLAPPRRWLQHDSLLPLLKGKPLPLLKGTQPQASGTSQKSQATPNTPRCISGASQSPGMKSTTSSGDFPQSPGSPHPQLDLTIVGCQQSRHWGPDAGGSPVLCAGKTPMHIKEKCINKKGNS